MTRNAANLYYVCMNLTAYIIFSGSELLAGKPNTYPPLFAPLLKEHGFSLKGYAAVGDNLEDLTNAVAQYYKTCRLLIIVGGLGPTFDDLTRPAVKKALKLKSKHSQAVAKHIMQRFKQRGTVMSKNNLLQAEIFEGADVLTNKFGTAPGQFIKIKNNAVLLLPGPYNEWNPMFKNCAVPKLHKFFKHKTPTKQIQINIAGMAESKVDEMVQPLLNKYNAEKTILSSLGIVRLFFTVSEDTAEKSNKVIAAIKKDAKAIFGSAIFGYGAKTLSEALGGILLKNKLTIATAESCTGGLAAHLITQTPGSSRYLEGGIVCYANAVKQSIGVKAETLKKFGAVSKETALEMAQSACNFCKTDCAIATTGVAGPGGGSKEKPVGTVYIAFGFKDGTAVVKRFNFITGRVAMQNYTATAALNMARLFLTEKFLSIKQPKAARSKK